MDWKPYRLKGLVEMRPFVPGEDLSEIYVGDPSKAGAGIICRNPENADEQHWYLDDAYVARNFDALDQ